MSITVDPYYDALAADYDHLIRRLVPSYDRFVEETVALLGLTTPETVLDLGVGTGTVAAGILEALPSVSLTGVDLSGPMLERAAQRLKPFRGRVTLVQHDLSRYDPASGLQGAVSSLVLHNLPLGSKADVLRRLRKALSPGSPFLWADMIRFQDRRVHERTVESRRDYARNGGCPESLLARNFEKEETEDFPLTVGETLELLREAGFSSTDVALAEGAFLLVRATA